MPIFFVVVSQYYLYQYKVSPQGFPCGPNLGSRLAAPFPSVQGRGEGSRCGQTLGSRSLPPLPPLPMHSQFTKTAG